jgi:hypothetical protein
MHPDFRTEIMKARTVEAHRAADRDRLAQAVEQNRPARAVEQGRPAQQWDGIRRLLPRLRLRPVLRGLMGDQAAS